MPIPTFAGSTVAMDGKVYVIGGQRAECCLPLDVVAQYDPATDSWRNLEPMPTARRWLSTGVVEGTIYAIGGQDNDWSDRTQKASPRVEAYDPSADRWTRDLADMLTPRYDFSIGIVDGKIYAIGGVMTGGGFSDVVEVYDPEEDAWTPLDPMPTGPRAAACAAVFDEKIYVIGGVPSQPRDPSLRTVDVYDAREDNWVQGREMPRGRMWSRAVVANGRIHVLGGFFAGLENSTITNTVDSYDPRLNEWTEECSMAVPRHNLMASAVNGSIYAMGGGGPVFTGGEGFRSVEEFRMGPPKAFLRGDCNDDGSVNIADAQYLLNYLFLGGSAPHCGDASDVNDDGQANIADAQYLLNHLFLGDPAPPAPFPETGSDPTKDQLAPCL